MKIAILSCFYPYRGGIAQFNASLAAELGRTNEVGAFNFKRQYPDLLFPGKTQFVTEEDEAVPVESSALLDTVNPFSWVKTARAIRAWNPDILILRYWMPFFAPSLGYVARRMNKSCKVIAILDNVIPHERRFFDGPLTRYFLSGADGCITLCSEVAADLVKIKPEARYQVGYHPLYSHFGEKLQREEAEDILGLEHGKKNILFFGLVREYKGLDILIDAFGKLGDDYQLFIAGEPYGSFERYAKQIEENPGKDRIHCFLNYVRDSEVKKFFSAADVTVLPYRSATQSGVSSVSYHFGVPMIVTAVGGLKETIGDRGTGLVASEVSSDAIKVEIERFFADESIRTGCASCIEAERQRLSWPEFCKELLKFAQSL